MKPGEVRELSVDELQQREKDLDDQLFRLRIQKSMGQLEAPAKVRGVRRDLARIKTILREKTVVVAVERSVRHGVYGKTQRKTSTFVAHNEGNDAKMGDTVAIAESRPISRRKRWVVVNVVARAAQV